MLYSRRENLNVRSDRTKQIQQADDRSIPKPKVVHLERNLHVTVVKPFLFRTQLGYSTTPSMAARSTIQFLLYSPNRSSELSVY